MKGGITTMGSKQKLLQSARELIYKNGYNNTSIRDILIDADAGKGQLYYYFDSKKSIGLAVIQANIEEWRTELFTDILAPSVEPEKDFLDMLNWFYSFHNSQSHYYGCPIGNLIIELSMEDEEFREVLEDFMTEWINVLAAKLIELDSEAYLNFEEAQDEARMIISQIQGSIVLLKATQDLTILKETFTRLEKKYVYSNTLKAE
ncbi:transcriptional regulator, TetR family [Enterococcus faecalis 13-SD-W-01]|jgi:TetR/AcrR family transcriptional repressor of nem operon|nr:transcriptional regulator, TetR family [Enterococcus faecalis 13-SD-W-01]